MTGIERLGHLFVANGITGADKRHAILLSVIGDSTYKLLSSLRTNSHKAW